MPSRTEEPIVEFLNTATIGEKGQLTVPKGYRDSLNLGAGSSFTILRIGDGLMLIPLQREFERLCREISDTLTNAGVTEEDFLSTLPEARKRVYERHYGAASKNRKNGGRRAK